MSTGKTVMVFIPYCEGSSKVFKMHNICPVLAWKEYRLTRLLHSLPTNWKGITHPTAHKHGVFFSFLRFYYAYTKKKPSQNLVSETVAIPKESTLFCFKWEFPQQRIRGIKTVIIFRFFPYFFHLFGGNRRGGIAKRVSDIGQYGCNFPIIQHALVGCHRHLPWVFLT